MVRTPFARSTAFILFAAGCFGEVETTAESPSAPLEPGAAAPAPPAGNAPAPPVSTPGTPSEPSAGGPIQETRTLRLPLDVYREAMAVLLRPILGSKLDVNRLAALSGPANEPGSSGYYEPGPPSTATVRFYLEAAEQLTAPLLTSTTLPCSAEQGAAETACMDGFIASTGRRAFRRPLSTEEISGYRGQYGALRASTDRATALTALLRSFAISPHFVFIIEGQRTSDRGDTVALDGWEIATRLAYFLWSSVPDDPLLDAVARGELATADGVEATARRMLSDKRAAAGLVTFVSQWLHFDGEAGAVAEGRSEAGLLLESIVLAGDGRMGSLLTAKHTFANAGLRATYGLPKIAEVTTSTFARADLPPERMGLLMLAGVLRGNGSATASPIKRGRVVRERLLCQEVPSPPDDVPPLADPQPGIKPTLRAQLEAHRSNPACKACHSFIDPIGFAFENFDENGKYVAGVDSKGELTQTDVDGPVNGARELVDRLARSGQVRSCATTQMYRMALGRREDRSDDASLTKASRAFADSDGNFRDLMVAIARSDAFRTRRNRDISK